MSRPSDIIVVGAGVIGCAVAFELARRGAGVQVVDGRLPGMGATQASAGMLAPYNETQDDHALFDLAVRSLEMYEDFVARAVAESGLPVPYQRTGSLDVATDAATLIALDTAAAALQRHGVRVDRLDAAGVHAAEPQLAPGVLGGLLIHPQGFVGASELTRSLALAARRRGASFVERSRVTHISCAGSEAIVETEHGTLEADAVVLAAGSWSGTIELEEGSGRLPMNPVRGQLLQLAWAGPPLRRILWSSRCYFVPREDGAVLAGATVEQAGFEERATVSGVRQLMEAACELVPQTMHAGFAGARVGLRPGTADNLPIIGRSRRMPCLMYATGHYRNGVLLAPLTAQVVADMLLDDRTEPALAAVSPERFPDL
jgi:glycine oxidase